MNRCYPSTVASICCSRPGPWSLSRPPEQWTAASGSRGPSSFSYFRPGGRAPYHLTGQLQFVGPSAMHGPRRLWRICRPERRAWGQFFSSRTPCRKAVMMEASEIRGIVPCTLVKWETNFQRVSPGSCLTAWRWASTPCCW
jgi:hypothetical protein